MKKIIISIIIIGLFISALTARAESLFTKNLYFGIQNDPEVIKLQEFLTNEGVYSGPITGNFFSLTLQGVKNFQTREDISPAAGYFGPITRAIANEILNIKIQASEQQAMIETGAKPTPLAAPKTTTDVVSSLQDQLNALLQQVSLLQQQLQTQQQTTLQQIQQSTQQIRQNTSPNVISNTLSIIPNSITVSTNKITKSINKKGDGIDIIAIVKDISGSPVQNQTVLFENGYSSVEVITNSDGVANVCFIGDYDSSVWRQTEITAKVLIPTISTFIQDGIAINAPIDQNLQNLSRLQQGRLYNFRCAASLDFPSDTTVSLETIGFKIQWQSYNFPANTICNATGDWNGNKPTSGSENLSYTTEGVYIYTLTCTNNLDFSITRSAKVEVKSAIPKININVTINDISQTETDLISIRRGDRLYIRWFVQGSPVIRCATYSNSNVVKEYRFGHGNESLSPLQSFEWKLRCLCGISGSSAQKTIKINVQ